MDGCQNIIGVAQRLDVREARDMEAPVEEKGVAPAVVVDLVGGMRLDPSVTAAR